MKITKRIEGWVQTGVRSFLEQLYQSYCLEKDVESDASLEIIGWSHSVLKWYNTQRSNQILINYRPYQKSKKYGWQISIQVNYCQRWQHFFHEEFCWFIFSFNFLQFLRTFWSIHIKLEKKLYFTCTCTINIFQKKEIKWKIFYMYTSVY